MTSTRSWRTTRVAAAGLAVAACVPYGLLKVAWLAGSSIGAASPEGAASLHDPRHTVGNAITLGMDAVVVVLALTLTLRRGLSVPAAVVVFPLWVGIGLLAPIAVGLPLGLVGQAVTGGSPAPADNELQDWVYAVVYGGFVVQAAGLLIAFLLYARLRWAALFRLRLNELPAPEDRSLGLRILVHGAGTVGFGYAGMHLAWAVAGDQLAGPPGFETVAQRVFLASVAVLVAAGAGAMLVLAGARRVGRPGDRAILLVAIAFVGTGVAFGSGLAELALAPPDRLEPLTAVVLVVGTLSGAVMWAAVARQIAGHLATGTSHVRTPSRRRPSEERAQLTRR